MMTLTLRPADPNWTIVEGFPLGAPANAALYGTRRTARYLALEAHVAEAVSAAHGEVPDAKHHQTEVCGWVPAALCCIMGWSLLGLRWVELAAVENLKRPIDYQIKMIQFSWSRVPRVLCKPPVDTLHSLTHDSSIN